MADDLLTATKTKPHLQLQKNEVNGDSLNPVLTIVTANYKLRTKFVSLSEHG